MQMQWRDVVHPTVVAGFSLHVGQALGPTAHVISYKGFMNDWRVRIHLPIRKTTTLVRFSTADAAKWHCEQVVREWFALALKE